MKKTTLAAALAVATGAVQAAGHDTASLQAEIDALKAQIKALETMVKDATATSQAQDRKIQELTENPSMSSGLGDGGNWFQNVEIGGLLEVEVGYNDP